MNSKIIEQFKETIRPAVEAAIKSLSIEERKEMSFDYASFGRDSEINQSKAA